MSAPNRRPQRSKYAQQYRHLYNTALWLRRRKHQLEEHPYCKMCEEDGHTRVATIADHVIPHKGDRQLFFEGELQSLCKQHHDSSKQQIERKGFRNGFNDLGEPLDPKHPWYSHEAKATG
jgi:5-methylcytosine-specific restriction protein A